MDAPSLVRRPIDAHSPGLRHRGADCSAPRGSADYTSARPGSPAWTNGGEATVEPRLHSTSREGRIPVWRRVLDRSNCDRTSKAPTRKAEPPGIAGPIGRKMRFPSPTGWVIALVLCLAISSARAETLTLIPAAPTETTSTVLRFQGVSTSFPAGVVLYRSTRSGSLLAVEGCYPTPSFPGIVNYTLDVPVGVLPAGTYGVTYSVARCNQQGVPIGPFVVLLTDHFCRSE